MNPSDISRWQGSVDSWLAQDVAIGSAVNPGDYTTICDTGQMDAGWYDITIILTGDGSHYYAEIQHRNVANTGDVYIWYATWGGTLHNTIIIKNWKIEETQRFRVVNRNASDDKLLATIQWVKRI